MLTSRRRGSTLRRGDGESGAVLVTAVILLTLLLGISALVIDLGYGMQKRRQIQNTADAAALAAAQDLPLTVSSATTARSFSTTNLPDGSFGWSGCTDSKKLAIASSGTQCISFDQSFTQVRVKVPEQTYNTFFGKVLGIDVLKTSGAATARVVGVGLASIQPFALFSGFTSGIACLKQGPSGHRITTCDEPETGNFNLLDITQYGNSSLSTPRNCGNSAERQRMIDNIAIGADHMFRIWAGGLETLDACDVPGPDTIPPRTGNDLDAFDSGLVHATAGGVSDGGKGRLQRGNYAKTQIAGMGLDNRPLWSFIPNQHLSDVPDSCQRQTFETLLTATPTAQQRDVMSDALETCFSDYSAGGYTGIVFGANTDPFGKELPIDLYDIQLSPRFNYIPQFVQGSPGTGSSDDYNITAFRAIFIHEIFGKCSSRGNCDIDFAPGPWNTSDPGSSTDKIEAMDAFVFPAAMLPVGLRGNPASIGQNTYVQLVK